MLNATVSLSKRADPCPLQQIQTRAVDEPSHCVWCSFMRASCYTSTLIISRLDAPSRFRRTSETPGGFLLLQALLADTVATMPFMWLPEKYAKPPVLHTHLTVCYYRCSLLCVHAKSVQVSICLNVHQSSSYRHWTAYSGSVRGWCKAQHSIVSMRRIPPPPPPPVSDLIFSSCCISSFFIAYSPEIAIYI